MDGIQLNPLTKLHSISFNLKDNTECLINFQNKRRKGIETNKYSILIKTIQPKVTPFDFFRMHDYLVHQSLNLYNIYLSIHKFPVGASTLSSILLVCLVRKCCSYMYFIYTHYVHTTNT